jgi:hypothetical protein
MFREVPFYVFGMVLYEQYKRCFNGSYFGNTTRDLSNREYIMIGALAGASASFITTPADVIKSRMMTAQAGTNAKTAQVIVDIIQKEGMMALFKGAVPRAVWIAPLGAMNFAGYELAKKAMGVLSDAAADPADSSRAEVSSGEGPTPPEPGTSGAAAASGGADAVAWDGADTDATNSVTSTKQTHRLQHAAERIQSQAFTARAQGQEQAEARTSSDSVPAAAADAPMCLENASMSHRGSNGATPDGAVRSVSVGGPRSKSLGRPCAANRSGHPITEQTLSLAQQQANAEAVARLRTSVTASGQGAMVQGAQVGVCGQRQACEYGEVVRAGAGEVVRAGAGEAVEMQRGLLAVHGAAVRMRQAFTGCLAQR